MPRILYFFALCNLVIGSSAYVLSGILQPVGTALGISVAAAGQVMTAYAVATAVLAPALIILTAKWSRKRAIQLALGLFTLGGLVSALAPDLITLLLGRMLMGAGAMFTAAASALAVSMVAPALLALNPMSPAQLSVTLAVFGLAGVAGTLVGGWANDRFGALKTILVQLAVLTSTMCLLPLTAGNVAATLVAWGIAGFGLMAPQQSRLASLSPTQAPLLLSLNGSMLYIGTALGAVISGALIDAVGFARLGWVGVPFGLLAILTLVFDRAPAASAVIPNPS